MCAKTFHYRFRKPAYGGPREESKRQLPLISLGGQVSIFPLDLQRNGGTRTSDSKSNNTIMGQIFFYLWKPLNSVLLPFFYLFFFFPWQVFTQILNGWECNGEMTPGKEGRVVRHWVRSFSWSQFGEERCTKYLEADWVQTPRTPEEGGRESQRPGEFHLCALGLLSTS